MQESEIYAFVAQTHRNSLSPDASELSLTQKVKTIHAHDNT